MFNDLLTLVPGLKDRILDGSPDDVAEIADLVCASPLYLIRCSRCKQLEKGAGSARSDDTKSIKGPIIDWITPPNEPLRPALARNMKMDRGFHHERTGALLCPVELNWDDPEYVQRPHIEISIYHPTALNKAYKVDS